MNTPNNQQDDVDYFDNFDLSTDSKPADALPEISPVPHLPSVDDSKSNRGCFCFTLPGIILSIFLGTFFVCCAIPFLFCSGIVGGAAFIFSTGESRTGNESFLLEPSDNVQLIINDQNADVSITRGTDDRVVIDYSITAYGVNNDNAKTNVDALVLDVERSTGGAFTLAVLDEGTTFNLFGLDLGALYDIELDIQLPADVDLIDITTGEGVTIENINGDFRIDASTSSNTVTLTDVSGSFNIEVGIFGDLNFRGELAPDSRNVFIGDTGTLNITILGDANVEYRANASSTTGEVRCPNKAPSTSCEGVLGDKASASLEARVDSGEININAIGQ